MTQVGATLGAESVKLSLAAGLLGLVIVVIFMIIYYRLPACWRASRSSSMRASCWRCSRPFR